MAKGMTFVPSNGGKWVYYDWITGKMAYGERLVNYDAAHTGWYHFDEHTGAMTHGFYYNASQHKWVCYDPVSGQMLHGQHAVNGHWYDFDDTTGAVKLRLCLPCQAAEMGVLWPPYGLDAVWRTTD